MELGFVLVDLIVLDFSLHVRRGTGSCYEYGSPQGTLTLRSFHFLTLLHRQLGHWEVHLAGE